MSVAGAWRAVVAGVVHRYAAGTVVIDVYTAPLIGERAGGVGTGG